MARGWQLLSTCARYACLCLSQHARPSCVRACVRVCVCVWVCPSRSSRDAARARVWRDSARAHAWLGGRTQVES